jgi:ACS family allantoate permease-like MFS transporter
LQTWLCFIFSVALQIPNGALTNFKNIILQGFGLTKEESLLYGAPSGAVQIVSTISVNYMADRTKNRLYWAIVSLALGILGFILMITLPEHNKGGNLAAFYITSCSSASFTLILSMISSNVGPHSISPWTVLTQCRFPARPRNHSFLRLTVRLITPSRSLHLGRKIY